MSNISNWQTGFQNPMLEETSPHLLLGAQDHWLDAEQDQLPRGSTGTTSVNCQETETCIVWACHPPRQPLQNHHSGHFGGRATPWSEEEMMDGQHPRVEIPAHARTAHNGLLEKRLEENLRWIVCHVPPTTRFVKGLKWTELNNKDAGNLVYVWRLHIS